MVAITQMPYKLGLVIFDVAGPTQLHAETYDLAPGLIPPEFPAVGVEAEFNIDALPHKTVIEQKLHTYFIAGDTISPRFTIVARKIP